MSLFSRTTSCATPVAAVAKSPAAAFNATVSKVVVAADL